jgi:hypothetical protein
LLLGRFADLGKLMSRSRRPVPAANAMAAVVASKAKSSGTKAASRRAALRPAADSPASSSEPVERFVFGVEGEAGEGDTDQPLALSPETVAAMAAADTGGKDELNLAEFPIAALTDRVPDGQLSLVFEDILEQRDGPPTVRRLTIMGTHKHGLPTAVDDEVMVGLIQLTKRRNNFTDAKVTFSRYELIELLGWPQSGQSYQRIEEALHRWVGVVLMYENAWWDNTAKSWVDENFHILDNVTLYDRERRRPAGGRKGAGLRRTLPGEAPLPLSSFRWNEVMFRSFQAGNLKQLDWTIFQSLRLPTTKRLYRFLDKRFYRRMRIDFDLRSFACEHIGMSKQYKPTELKRRLKPAIDELEEKGFLEPLVDDERYSFQAKGQWRILFIRGPYGRDEPRPEPAAEVTSLVEALVARGVVAKVASELVATHPISRVRTKLEVFDWLVQNRDKRVERNPAGYLVAAIRADYSEPADWAAKAAKAAAREADRRAAEAARREQAEAAAAEATAAEMARVREARSRECWEALTDPQRDAITARVRAENPGLRRWKSMIEPLCLAELDRLMAAGEPIPSTAAQGRLFSGD